MAAADQLTFPTYKTEQLAHFFATEVLLEQEGRCFSKSDLHPVVKPETVKMLYMRTLQHVFRIDPECLHMIPLHLIDDIEIPSFHEGATAVLRLYHRMRHFLPTCLVYDFNLSDILSPKTKRTALILSGIMNYLQFRKGRMDFVREHDSKLRADKDRFQSLTRGVKDAERKLVMLKTIPPAQQAEAKKLKSEITEQQSANEHSFTQVRAVKDSIAERKSKRAERTQALAKLKVAVSTRCEDNAAIQSQILESPEELKMEMDKMKQTVKSIKAATVKSDEFVVELQSKAQVLNHSDSEVQLICSLLQDLHTGLENGKQDVLEVDKSVSELERQQKEMKSAATEVDREKRSDSMKLDKLSKQRLRRKNMRETAECHIQSVMKKCDLYPEKQEEMDNYIQKVNNEMQQLKAKIQIMVDTCNHDTRKAQDVNDRLTAALDRLHQSIEASQEEIQLTLQEKGK